MSRCIKLTLSDENYEKLKEKAGNSSLQNYIFGLLFPEQVTNITPENAYNLALKKYKPGEKFSVPEIFGDKWTLGIGFSGAFGRQFFLLTDRTGSKIKFTGSYNEKGQANYEIIENGDH